MPPDKRSAPLTRRGAHIAAADDAPSVPRTGDRSCRRYGGCQWWARCAEHSGDPQPIGQILADLVAAILGGRG